MGVPYRHIPKQTAVLAGFGRLAGAAIRQRLGGGASEMQIPGPRLTRVVGARDPQLVRDYVRWCGGDPSAYRGRLPAHLFPQWGFPLLGDAISGVTYPLARVLNGGCRIEIHHDIPADEPLHLSGQLTTVDDNGRRAVLHQELVTATADGVARVTAQVYGIIPLGRGTSDGGEKPKAKKEKPTVPGDAREIGWWRLGPDAGLTFACLTGDFNPVHWVVPYAKASGFRSTILHGFATLARSIEAMNRVLWAGDTRRLATIDVRFTRPLRLPARVGCYVRGDQIFVGDGPGAPAYLTGSFTTRGVETVNA